MTHSPDHAERAREVLREAFTGYATGTRHSHPAIIDAMLAYADERVAAALRGRDAVVEADQEVCRRLAHRMQVACDRTRAGKDHVKVATADWHGLMDIAEQARAALHVAAHLQQNGEGVGQ